MARYIIEVDRRLRKIHDLAACNYTNINSLAQRKTAKRFDLTVPNLIAKTDISKWPNELLLLSFLSTTSQELSGTEITFEFREGEHNSCLYIRLAFELFRDGPYKLINGYEHVKLLLKELHAVHPFMYAWVGGYHEERKPGNLMLFKFKHWVECIEQVRWIHVFPRVVVEAIGRGRFEAAHWHEVEWWGDHLFTSLCGSDFFEKSKRADFEARRDRVEKELGLDPVHTVTVEIPAKTITFPEGPDASPSPRMEDTEKEEEDADMEDSNVLNLQYPPTAEHAADNAGVVVEAAMKFSKVKLDFSPASVAHVERIIEDFRKEKVDVKAIRSTLFSFGCYVGEVLVRAKKGKWIETEKSPMKGYAWSPIVVELGPGNVCNPIDKVFKRFENGPTESLVQFCTLFLSRRK